jgi:hypothetical protein
MIEYETSSARSTQHERWRRAQLYLAAPMALNFAAFDIASPTDCLGSAVYKWSSRSYGPTSAGPPGADDAR